MLLLLLLLMLLRTLGRRYEIIRLPLVFAVCDGAKQAFTDLTHFLFIVNVVVDSFVDDVIVIVVFIIIFILL
jgi:hypothetical protein